MQAVNFTDRIVASLPRPAKRIRIADAKVRGLYLTHYPTDRKSWVVRLGRGGGFEVKLPHVDRLSVEDARRQAKKIIGEAAQGIAAKQVKANRETFTALAKRWLKRQEQRAKDGDIVKSTVTDRTHDVNYYLVPKIGTKIAAKIRRADIRAALTDIRTEHGPESCRRALKTVRAIYAWVTTVEESLEVNPALGIKLDIKQTPRGRVLNDTELAMHFGYVREARKPSGRGPGAIRRALHLQCLTLVRGAEVAGANKTEFDLDQGLWVVPAERMKSRRAHVVPLSKQALDLVRDLIAGAKDGWLFPNKEGNGPTTSPRMGMVTRRMSGGHSIPSYGPHDVRRTGRTRLSGLGVTREVAERILAHAQDRIVETYDLYDYLTEKRSALQLWADELDRIVSAAEGKELAPDGRDNQRRDQTTHI
jgi:integrase